MKRRAFITLLGSAVAWPLVARGQHQGVSPVIGCLVSSSATQTSDLLSIDYEFMPTEDRVYFTRK